MNVNVCTCGTSGGMSDVSPIESGGEIASSSRMTRTETLIVVGLLVLIICTTLAVGELWSLLALRH